MQCLTEAAKVAMSTGLGTGTSALIQAGTEGLWNVTNSTAGTLAKAAVYGVPAPAVTCATFALCNILSNTKTSPIGALVSVAIGEIASASVNYFANDFLDSTIGPIGKVFVAGGVGAMCTMFSAKAAQCMSDQGNLEENRPFNVQM